MNKQQAARTVVLYCGVFFGAVLLRVDYYPFTWVPMYGERQTEDLLLVTVGDLKKRQQGFRATLADGSTEYLDRKDLNIPSPNFRRLYAERMFGEGPPQFQRERLALAGINRWWYDTLIGPLDIPEGMYQQQVLDSINRTLERGPSDPRHVASIEAEVGQIAVTREQRRSGNFSALNPTQLRAKATADGSLISVFSPNPGY